MDVEKSSNIALRNKKGEKLLYMPEHENYHGKSFNCVIVCELSQSQITSKSTFENPYMQKRDVFYLN